MRQLFYSTLFLLLSLQAVAQRVATDSVLLPCNTNGLSPAGSGYDIQLAGPGAFWTIYSKSRRGSSGHSSWHGNITIEKHDTQTLAVKDSLTFKGTGAILETETDNAGNLYLLGYSRDSVIFNSNHTTYADKYFLVKLNANMQIVWINDTITGGRLAVSPNGNYIYLRGDLGGFAGDVYVYQLDGAGKMTLSKKMVDIGYMGDLTTNNDGTLYFSGGCIDNKAMLDTVDASHSYSYTSYYGKFSKDLTCEWIKILEDITCLQPWVKTDSAGNLLYLSAFRRSNMLDNIPLSYSSEEILLASTTEAGKVNFALDVPGTTHRVALSNFNARCIDTRGNMTALLLQHKGTNDTINWSTTAQTISNVWTGTPILLEIDNSTGIATMATEVYLSSYIDMPGNVLYLPGGDVLVTKGKDTTGINIIRLKLKPTGGISNLNNAGTTIAYPNPTTSVVNFSNPVSGTLYDIAGRETGMYQKVRSIDMSGLNNGVYFLHTNEGRHIKLVKQ